MEEGKNIITEQKSWQRNKSSLFCTEMSLIQTLPSRVKVMQEIRMNLPTKEKHLTVWQGRDWDGTHRLDLSCISFPVTALSLGLKWLSGFTSMYAHTHTRRDTHIYRIMLIKLKAQKHGNTDSFLSYSEKMIMLQCTESRDMIIVNKDMNSCIFSTSI